MPWANGLGVTAEIHAARITGASWAWRLSIADVADDGPFSVLPDVDRHIAVVQGEGMGLRFDGGAEQRLTFAAPAVSFAGDTTTMCRLLDGPIMDLNLMVRRSHGMGAMLIERLPAGHALGDDDLVGAYSYVAAVVVVQGSLWVDAASPAAVAMNPFDALLLDAGEPLPRLFAETDAILAIVVLHLHDPA
ncbi:unannotated protein [freshwater metagenome]|uniref:Unannotated protein n=1 Tax=freshwater metagenome TaxID=449393 RepID=A0A6J7G271_9ZZZZ|nr:HutD family protein [Actinomycetota bacterium]